MDHKRNHGERSLVLITVDCLRADHCGLYGYSQPTTPFLDSLAPESFVVPSAIVGGAPTYYSLPAILASRMPLSLGRDVVGLAPGESTLATALRDSGYATAAFSAANPYISQRFGYDQGFEVFHDFLDFASRPAQPSDGTNASSAPGVSGVLNRSIKNLASALGLSPLYNELYFQYCMKIAPAVHHMDALRSYPAADILVDQAQSWLASVEERPFFLWLHLMDPHSPYYPPNQAYRALTGSDIQPTRARYLNAYWNRFNLAASGLREKRNEVVQLYDAGIRWVDCQVARLVESLRQSGLWDDCVLALTADHGEEFLEHGGRYHPPVRLTEEVVHVPLIIRVPGHTGAKVPKSPMSHLHLAPTLLDIMGLPSPSSFHGRSLWTNFQSGIAWDDPAIIECVYGCTNPSHAENRNMPRLLGVRDARFKFVMRLEPGSTEELYDLEMDAGELHPDGGGRSPDSKKQLLLAARDYMNSTVGRQDPMLRLRARLRDLRGQILH